MAAEQTKREEPGWMQSYLQKAEIYFYDTMDSVWANIPRPIESILAFFIVFFAGIGMRGEWLFAVIHLYKHIWGLTVVPDEEDLSFTSLFHKRMQGFTTNLFFSLVISFVFYLGICGFLQWYFYVRQHDKPKEWKCQPNKYMSWEDERHEILFGCYCCFQGSVLSATLTTYVMNGGYTSLYFQWDQYGYWWLLLQVPVLFLYLDFVAFHHHILFHMPFLYKNFHKMHHRYKQPTAFSATAFHPAELLVLQFLFVFPIFFLPCHWVVYFCNLFYLYYYGIMDHSGVKMVHVWPWQPTSMFHDEHHQYFHCNFGFNTMIWDRMYGTLRKTGRVYTEDVYYGKGKDPSLASKQEMKDFKEALSWG